MNKTYNVAEAVQAQKEYCKEYAAKYPEDWASGMMKDGKGFAPVNGVCYCCHQQIYSAEGREYIGLKHPTGRMTAGISVEEARNQLTTGCPFCHRSFVD